MRVENIDRLEAPPGEVSELFCSERFLVLAHGAREDVASASYEVLEESETHMAFAVRCQQYRRKKTGGIDRKNTDETTITYRVDRSTNRAEWRFDGPDGDKIRISGVTTFDSTVDGTLVTETAEIHARVPLIGRFIEKVIAKGIDKTFDGNRGLVREMLASS